MKIDLSISYNFFRTQLCDKLKSKLRKATIQSGRRLIKIVISGDMLGNSEASKVAYNEALRMMVMLDTAGKKHFGHN
jgi:hypothetical protein